ncbi:hypothetical protein XANCAGTX0491_007163 [Xanthoria calcicola]
MTNDVVTLCIYYSKGDMARHRDYPGSYLSCEWDHVEVATIRVCSQSPNSRANRCHDGADEPSIGDTITNSVAPLRTDVQPRFFYPSNASQLDITLVFITVMNVRGTLPSSSLGTTRQVADLRSSKYGEH